MAVPDAATCGHQTHNALVLRPASTVIARTLCRWVFLSFSSAHTADCSRASRRGSLPLCHFIVESIKPSCVGTTASCTPHFVCSVSFLHAVLQLDTMLCLSFLDLVGLADPCSKYCCTKKISNLVLDRSQSRELFVFVVQLNIGWVSCLPGRLELDLSCSTSFNAGIAFHVERGTCIIMSSISFGSMSAVVEVCVRPQKHSSRHPTSVSVSSFTCEVAACVQSFESVDHQLHR